MALESKNFSRPRNQNGSGRLKLTESDRQPKGLYQGEQDTKANFCPQCGAVMTWWRGLPFCSRCGWREGCCD
ncbi:MAG: hypothetical protein ACK40X_01350 [Armatimonadota bacterium]